MQLADMSRDSLDLCSGLFRVVFWSEDVEHVVCFGGDSVPRFWERRLAIACTAILSHTEPITYSLECSTIKIVIGTIRGLVGTSS